MTPSERNTFALRKRPDIQKAHCTCAALKTILKVLDVYDRIGQLTIYNYQLEILEEASPFLFAGQNGNVKYVWISKDYICIFADVLSIFFRRIPVKRCNLDQWL